MRMRTVAVWLVVALTALSACGMARHRAQIRQGLLTRGLHRDAFLAEWGHPARTFPLAAGNDQFRVQAWTGRIEPIVYEVWEYPDRATCLTFDKVRLIAWQTGRTDCTPKERVRRERPEPKSRPRSRGSEATPYPPYPE